MDRFDIDVTPERIALLAGNLDSHVREPGTPRCTICGTPAPCAIRFAAERELYLLGYMRSTDRPHPLRDAVDYVTWLRDEIPRREAVPVTDPESDRVQASLPELRQRLVDAEAALLVAAGEVFPDATT